MLLKLGTISPYDPFSMSQTGTSLESEQLMRMAVSTFCLTLLTNKIPKALVALIHNLAISSRTPALVAHGLQRLEDIIPNYIHSVQLMVVVKFVGA